MESKLCMAAKNDYGKNSERRRRHWEGKQERGSIAEQGSEPRDNVLIVLGIIMILLVTQSGVIAVLSCHRRTNKPIALRAKKTRLVSMRFAQKTSIVFVSWAKMPIVPLHLRKLEQIRNRRHISSFLGTSNLPNCPSMKISPSSH
jgi:hypothetical protein